MPPSKSTVTDDALLAGLARLPPTSQEIDPQSISHPVLPSVSLARGAPRMQASGQGRPPLGLSSSSASSAAGTTRHQRRSSTSQMGQLIAQMHSLDGVGQAWPRVPATAPALPVPRVDPLDPIARIDVHEMVERATGFVGKSGKGDRAAAERLLQWMRAGSVDPIDVFRKVVAGTDASNPDFNARVLAVTYWLCIVGGPAVLAGGLHATHPRRPCALLRIVLDVLRALGRDNAEDLLHDDAYVRAMHLTSPSSRNSSSSPPSSMSSRPRGRAAIAATASAVEAYAISLGRKFIFHQRYPDVEANYSLDRFYRSLHVENNADDLRRDVNDERHSVIISRAALTDVALIALAATASVQRLEYAQATQDIVILALSEATNALIFAEYLSLKLSSSGMSDYDLTREKQWLRRKLREVVENGGNDVRMLKRFVDPNVYRSITEPDARPSRPESRHRREIVCHFTSFQGLHKALSPPSALALPSRSRTYR